MSNQPCLFCGGDPDAAYHDRRCGARPSPIDDFDPPPVAGITRETLAASVDAARQIEPNAATLRAAVLAHIRGCAARGATDDEIQLALDLDGNTERPRRWELYKAGVIHAIGYRVNRRGRRCAVWCVGGAA